MPKRSAATRSPTSRTSVLIHLTAHQYGGVETHTFHLSHALADAGFAVTLTSQRRLDLNADWARSLTDKGVRLVRPPARAATLPGAWGLLQARTVLARQLRRRAFDFVVGQGHGGAFRWAKRFVKPGGWFIWQEYWDGLPTKGDTYSGYRSPAPERLSGRMLRMIAALDGIVTGCERARANLTDVQGISKPMAVIPPLSRIDPATASERSYDAGSILNVVAIGRMGRGKGTDVLVDMWPRLPIQPAVLHLHGAFEDPALLDRVEAAAAAEPTIINHGPYATEDLPAILASADVGVMLSIEEGYGLAATEFMAAGLPFVMTDCGAAPEFTRDNPDAVLVDIDRASVAAGLAALCGRVRARATSRTRLAERYRRCFSYDVIAARHVAFFQHPEAFLGRA